jgi:uncharacterized membrane protein (UPF0182 family)
MPQLRYVIAVFNQDVSIEPTLDEALSSALGSTVSGVSPPPSSSGSTGTGGGSSKSTATTQDDLNKASTDYTAAQTALSNGNLGQYQRDVNEMNAALQAAQTALSKG